MAVDRTKIIGKLDIVGVIKGFENPTKTNGEVVTNVLNMLVENPITKSTVAFPFFMDNWEQLQYFDNGQPQRVSEKNATEDMKRKAIKYEIKGAKETKTYLTAKAFVDDLKKLQGKKVKVIGNSKFGLNKSGFLQNNLEVRQIEYVDQTTKKFRLESECHILVHKQELDKMTIDKELEIYIPLNIANEYYKQKAIIPSEIFLDGLVKDNIDIAKQVVENMKKDSAELLANNGYYLIPAKIELESGKSVREANVSDISQARMTFMKVMANGDDKKLQADIEQELKNIGTIAVERGTINISLFALDKIDFVEYPSLQDASGSTNKSGVSTQNAMQQAMEQMKANKSVAPTNVPVSEPTITETEPVKEQTNKQEIPVEQKVEVKEEVTTDKKEETSSEDIFPF